MRKALATAIGATLGAVTVITACGPQAGQANRRANSPASAQSTVTGTVTSTTTSGAADADGGNLVVDWNRALLTIVRTPGAQPATEHPTRSFAIMHAAIYDAVASATHSGPPIFAKTTAATTATTVTAASGEAAAVQAGHDTLTALYPGQHATLDRQLATELTAIPDGPAKTTGVRIGQTAAKAALTARARDGSDATPPPFVPGHRPGDYQLTPPAFPAPVFTNWPDVIPFVLRRAAQFRPPAYPDLRGRRYGRSVNEVKSLGQDTSTTRTADQTTAAKFWAAPIWNYWNEIAQGAAEQHHIGLIRTARLFAVLDLTFADSAIAFYDGKYHYRIWRPVTAIRGADTDGNPATSANPTWNPLATTPPDPSYPGAHSVVGQAGATVLTAFFGPNDHITVTSEALPGVTRSFTRYQDAADEAGLSRIYAGIHTRLDHIAGQRLGRLVARYVLHATNATGRPKAGLGRVRPGGDASEN